MGVGGGVPPHGESESFFLATRKEKTIESLCRLKGIDHLKLAAFSGKRMIKTTNAAYVEKRRFSVQTISYVAFSLSFSLSFHDKRVCYTL